MSNIDISNTLVEVELDMEKVKMILTQLINDGMSLDDVKDEQLKATFLWHNAPKHRVMMDIMLDYVTSMQKQMDGVLTSVG